MMYVIEVINITCFFFICQLILLEMILTTLYDIHSLSTN